MLTVIFGAGASYDSDPDRSSVIAPDRAYDKLRPPLAKGLFDNPRYGVFAYRYPEALPLMAQLRRAARNNPSSVEEELDAISADLPFYSTAYRQLLALRYYLSAVISSAQNNWLEQNIYGISTYQEFLNIVNKWQVRTHQQISLITFNYDTLLDIALESLLNIKLDDMNSYINNYTAYKLFKVHGSINWVHRVGKVYDNNIISSANHLVWTDQYYTQNQERPIISETGYAPALAIPTATKKSFEFPETHLEQMKAAIRETDLLLIIGWRGAEHHFVDTWREVFEQKTLKKIGVVSSKLKKPEQLDHRMIRDAKLVSDSITYYGRGFSQFVPYRLKSFLPLEPQ
jgi:hypothetical protein